MKRVAVDDVAARELAEASERRGLSDPLGTTDVALNHYRIAPGDGLPGGVHAHADQEEVFVVLRGTATFATRDGAVRVGAGEAVRFGRGEFQSGRNAGETELVVLALGAPRESEDVRIPVHCPDCGHDDSRLDFAGGLSFTCPDCGVERIPAPCPACGSEDMRMTFREDGETAAVCGDCEAEFASPPVR